MSQFPFPQQAPQGYPQGYPQAPQGYPQQAPAFQPQQGFPPHTYAPPAQAPVYPPQGYPQAPQGAGMGWAPQAPAYPQAPVGPPPAQGSLEAFNSQPATGRAKGITFKGVDPGTQAATYTGTVVADVTDRDVTQDSDPQTKQLKFYRDGRPMFSLAVGLVLDPGTYVEQLYPGGQATLYVRGRLHDALVAGMAAAGVSGVPKAGDRLQVTLTERRPGNGAIPANIFHVSYVAGPSWGNVQAPAPQQAPQAPPVIQDGQSFVQGAPAQPQAPQAPVAYAQPVQAPPAQATHAPTLDPQAYQQAPQAPTQAPPMGQPLPQVTADQAALLARITGQAPQA